jgi:hypothetical protein
MMNDSNIELKKPEDPAADEPSKGPSLVVIYSIVALALILATFCAAMIVLPFYQHR